MRMHEDACNTAAMVVDYTYQVAGHVHQLVSRGCERTAAGSAQLRDLLTQPVLCLLGSPLLDQLAVLQHAPTIYNIHFEYHSVFLPQLDSRNPSSNDHLTLVMSTPPLPRGFCEWPWYMLRHHLFSPCIFQSLLHKAAT